MGDLSEITVHRRTNIQRAKDKKQRNKREKLRHGRPVRMSSNERNRRKRTAQKLARTGFYKKIGAMRSSFDHEAHLGDSVRHPDQFIETVLAASAVLDEEDAREFAKRFLSKSPVYTNTKIGLAALMFEALVAEKEEDLWTRFVETIIESTTFLAVFEGKPSKEEEEKLAEEVNEVCKINVLVRAGDVDVEAGERSDVTIIECTPVAGVEKLAKDKAEGNTVNAIKQEPGLRPAKMEDYEQVVAEGGISHSVFTFLYGDAEFLDDDMLEDCNGVRWMYHNEAWVPVLSSVVPALLTKERYEYAASQPATVIENAGRARAYRDSLARELENAALVEDDQDVLVVHATQYPTVKAWFAGREWDEVSEGFRHNGTTARVNLVGTTMQIAFGPTKEEVNEARTQRVAAFRDKLRADRFVRETHSMVRDCWIDAADESNVKVYFKPLTTLVREKDEDGNEKKVARSAMDVVRDVILKHGGRQIMEEPKTTPVDEAKLAHDDEFVLAGLYSLKNKGKGSLKAFFRASTGDTRKRAKAAGIETNREIAVKLQKLGLVNADFSVNKKGIAALKQTKIPRLQGMVESIDEAGGEAPGKMELASTGYDKALEFAKSKGFDPEKDIPNFKKHYMAAQAKAKMGWTQRKDMPVIDTADVKKFQKRLQKGQLDINKPFAKDPAVGSNPFPTGLSGVAAKKFLDKGLRDGSRKDDQIPVRITKKKVGDLKPIQKQIYYDKSMGSTAKNGAETTRDFIKNRSFFIVSSDNYIIDGHHRFLSAMLLDPTMKVNALEIDLPIKKLLPLSLSYGDAIGNKRNEDIDEAEVTLADVQKVLGKQFKAVPKLSNKTVFTFDYVGKAKGKNRIVNLNNTIGRKLLKADIRANHGVSKQRKENSLAYDDDKPLRVEIELNEDAPEWKVEHYTTNEDGYASKFHAWTVTREGTDDGKTILQIGKQAWKLPITIDEVKAALDRIDTYYPDLPEEFDLMAEAFLKEYAEDNGETHTAKLSEEDEGTRYEFIGERDSRIATRNSVRLLALEAAGTTDHAAVTALMERVSPADAESMMNVLMGLENIERKRPGTGKLKDYLKKPDIKRIVDKLQKMEMIGKDFKLSKMGRMALRIQYPATANEDILDIVSTTLSEAKPEYAANEIKMAVLSMHKALKREDWSKWNGREAIAWGKKFIKGKLPKLDPKASEAFVIAGLKMFIDAQESETSMTTDLDEKLVVSKPKWFAEVNPAGGVAAKLWDLLPKNKKPPVTMIRLGQADLRKYADQIGVSTMDVRKAAGSINYHFQRDESVDEEKMTMQMKGVGKVTEPSHMRKLAKDAGVAPKVALTYWGRAQAAVNKQYPDIKAGLEAGDKKVASRYYALTTAIFKKMIKGAGKKAKEQPSAVTLAASEIEALDMSVTEFTVDDVTADLILWAVDEACGKSHKAGMNAKAGMAPAGKGRTKSGKSKKRPDEDDYDDDDEDESIDEDARATAKKIEGKVFAMMQKHKGKKLRGVEVADLMKRKGPGSALPVQMALDSLAKQGKVKSMQPDPDEPMRFVYEGTDDYDDDPEGGWASTMLEKATTATAKCPECGTKVLKATGYCVKCDKKTLKEDEVDEAYGDTMKQAAKQAKVSMDDAKAIDAAMSHYDTKGYFSGKAADAAKIAKKAGVNVRAAIRYMKAFKALREAVCAEYEAALEEGSLQVANTIAKQIGSGALFLIGAKKLVGLDNGLMFNVGRNKLNVNKVKITLTSMDDYTIEFIRTRGADFKVKKEIKGVYADKLREIIGDSLGLVTKMPKIVFSKGESVDDGDTTNPKAEVAEAATVTTAEVKDYVKSLRTWFEPENEEADRIDFTSREYGDVGEEQPGQKDIAEAKRLMKALRDKFGKSIKISGDVVDEWVTVSVSGLAKTSKPVKMEAKIGKAELSKRPTGDLWFVKVTTPDVASKEAIMQALIWDKKFKMVSTSSMGDVPYFHAGYKAADVKTEKEAIELTKKALKAAKVKVR
jgi:hypothetical protein